MGAYRFTNNAESTLAAGITAGATALTVASAATFPAAGNFTIVVDSEIMLVTGVAGATFTVSRAQESTSAAAHSAGATVRHVVTAGALEGLIHSGTSFPTNPSSNDRFFRTDRALEYIYNAALGRWLTTQVFTDDFRIPDGLTSNASVWGSTWLAYAYDVYLIALEASIYVGGTNDINNYWALVLKSYDGSTATTITEANSASQSALTMVQSHTPIESLVLASGGIDAFVVQPTKAGSGSAPGALYAAAKLIYRLAG